MPFVEVKQHSFKAKCSRFKGGTGFMSFVKLEDEVAKKYWPEVSSTLFAMPAVYKKFQIENPRSKDWKMMPRAIRGEDIEGWCEQNGLEYVYDSIEVYEYDEAELLDHNFSMRSEGAEFKEIAESLNRKGWLTYTGTSWTPENVNEWMKARS